MEYPDYPETSRDAIGAVLQSLARLGITETTIFPDLEGLARELRREFGIDKTRPKAM